MSFLAFWVCCLYELLGLQGVLLILASCLQGMLLILASCLQGVLLIWASWPFGCATYMGFKLPNLSSCMVDITQHALKGQKLLAQGNALGIMSVSNAPCKGKSFKIHIIKKDNPLRYVKLLPFTGRQVCVPQNLLILAKKQPKYLEVTKFQSIFAKE